MDWELCDLTTGNPFTLFRLRAQDGCDRSAEDAYSSMAHDPAFAFVEGFRGLNQLGGTFFNGRPLPVSVRQMILNLHRDGVKSCEISRLTKVSHGCVSKLINRYQNTGSIAPSAAGGSKPKVSTDVVVDMVVKFKTKNPEMFAREIGQLLIQHGVCSEDNVPSISSINRILRRNDLGTKSLPMGTNTVERFHTPSGGDFSTGSNIACKRNAAFQPQDPSIGTQAGNNPTLQLSKRKHRRESNMNVRKVQKTENIIGMTGKYTQRSVDSSQYTSRKTLARNPVPIQPRPSKFRTGASSSEFHHFKPNQLVTITPQNGIQIINQGPQETTATEAAQLVGSSIATPNNVIMPVFQGSSSQQIISSKSLHYQGNMSTAAKSSEDSGTNKKSEAFLPFSILDPTFGLIHVSPAPPELLSLFGLTKHQQTTAPSQKNTTDITTQCESAEKLETRDCSSNANGHDDKVYTAEVSFHHDLQSLSADLDTTSDSNFSSDHDSILDSISQPSDVTPSTCNESSYSLGVAH